MVEELAAAGRGDSGLLNEVAAVEVDVDDDEDEPLEMDDEEATLSELSSVELDVGGLPPSVAAVCCRAGSA